jgi:altronate dehydratase large subunit
MTRKMRLTGFPRPDGSVGFRNHIIILSTVVCANHVVTQIANEVPGCIPITHQHGCDQLGSDAELTFRTMVGISSHPNVYGVLVVGLGCEQLRIEKIVPPLLAAGKMVESFYIQESGGTTGSVTKGSVLVRSLLAVEPPEREQVSIADLTVGLECGGSDYSSGIASNQVVGEVANLLIKEGAKVILSETTEIIGAEHILAKRAVTPEVARFLIAKAQETEAEALRLKVDLRQSQPSPGNIAGGLTTIEEKSLGAICKGGTAPIVDGLEYAERVRFPGLSFMDTPGNDVESMIGMVAGGAQILLFTTGRGSPVGCPVAPVIKVCANPVTVTKMHENIDFDASPVLDQSLSIKEAGQNLFDLVLEVAAGRQTMSELLGHYEFALHRIGRTT